jgi:hypothetical protein
MTVGAKVSIYHFTTRRDDKNSSDRSRRRFLTLAVVVMTAASAGACGNRDQQADPELVTPVTNGVATTSVEATPGGGETTPDATGTARPVDEPVESVIPAENLDTTVPAANPAFERVPADEICDALANSGVIGVAFEGGETPELIGDPMAGDVPFECLWTTDYVDEIIVRTWAGDAGTDPGIIGTVEAGAVNTRTLVGELAGTSPGAVYAGDTDAIAWGIANGVLFEVYAGPRDNNITPADAAAQVAEVVAQLVTPR